MGPSRENVYLRSRRAVLHRHTGAVTDLLQLCADLPEEATPLGEVLIAEGTAPGRMLVLVSGSVRVERDGVALARIDTPGAVFGEMSAVLGRPATATLRAESPVRVRVIDDPLTFLVEAPGVALAVLRMTAARLDGLTQYVADVKAQLAGSEGHLAMVGQILDTLVHHQAPPVRPGSARDPEGTASH
jgi:CRP/FNR family transcriptional regulator, cyclic AMP receptor protein